MILKGGGPCQARWVTPSASWIYVAKHDLQNRKLDGRDSEKVEKRRCGLCVGPSDNLLEEWHLHPKQYLPPISGLVAERKGPTVAQTHPVHSASTKHWYSTRVLPSLEHNIDSSYPVSRFTVPNPKPITRPLWFLRRVVYTSSCAEQFEELPVLSLRARMFSDLSLSAAPFWSTFLLLTSTEITSTLASTNADGHEVAASEEHDL